MKKLLILSLFFLLTACPQKKEPKPDELSAPVKIRVELQAAAFDELEGWQQDNLMEILPNLQSNCNRIRKITTEKLGKSKIKIDTKPYQKICDDLDNSSFQNDAELRNFLEQNFTPFLVLDNGVAEGKFTSYYESQINASFRKHGAYKYPVYGLPEDWVEINLRDFDASLPDKRLVGRIDKKKILPYYDRAAIETNGIKAPVLMWADSDVDVHIMQIQGSAVAHMDDGQKVRVGYADNNGHNFRGIGSILKENNVLASGQINMSAIKKWLKDNPQSAQKYLHQNPRYIFHRIINESGPIGAFGIPLQAGRSMAVDRDIVPLGAILWLSTTAPDGTLLRKLVAAQDIGSAIKGVVRGDYFWGSGGDEVLDMAGKMNAVGKYFILLPKGQHNGLDG